MLFRSGGARGAKSPGAGPALRLGYCLNLHPAETLTDVLAALTSFTVPLRGRVGRPQEPFGVGMYLAAPVARELLADDGKLAELRAVLEGERLDPFTFNAFPQGGFQVDGLKERVYAPDWSEPDRLGFTVNVARIAAALNSGMGEGRHVSISTHPGAYGAHVKDRSMLRRCAEAMGRAVGELVRIEAETGVRIVLSLESEPDASARNARALAESLVFGRLVGSRVLQDEFGHGIEDSAELMRRHLGTCLDCCHSAVEFEEPADSVALAAHGGPIGKVQFSSALRLPSPGSDEEGRTALLGLDEPRFLHQVTAMSGGEFHHLPDLPALAAEVGTGGAWDAADEWRCHFHVPVDLAGTGGLITTQDHADAVLRELLAGASDPAKRWGTEELHVEIETYTWSVLPGQTGPPIDGLAREYEHVLALLDGAGWKRGPGPEKEPDPGSA